MRRAVGDQPVSVPAGYTHKNGSRRRTGSSSRGQSGERVSRGSLSAWRGASNLPSPDRVEVGTANLRQLLPHSVKLSRATPGPAGWRKKCAREATRAVE
jgi:hypothetical protein